MNKNFIPLSFEGHSTSNDTVYLCLDCGRVSSTKIDVCPLCKGKNITAFQLSGIYGGGG